MDITKQISKIKEIIKENKHTLAFHELCRLADPGSDFAGQSEYAGLLKLLDAAVVRGVPLRLAILPTSTVSHFIPILKFWLSQSGFSTEIYVAEHNVLDQEILDPNSRLYTFKPDIVLLFTNYRDLKFQFKIDQAGDAAVLFVDAYVQKLKHYWLTLQKHVNCFIIQNNVDMPLARVLGNFEANVKWSELNIYRQINLSLAENAIAGVTIFDMEYLSAQCGKKKWHEQRFWYHSKHSFNPDAYGIVAHAYAKLISAIKGMAKKCLILDLDNTLWGGVIADDGLENIILGGQNALGEAYVDFQKYVLNLKNRGIILGICSKNDLDAVKEVFVRHPDMQIRLEDIAVIKANWKNKADNIIEMAKDLNIGLDSLVFVDDSPHERELVRSLLPMVTVPEMPPDPVDFIQTIDEGRYFEMISISPEDVQRNKLYQDNFKRLDYQKSCQTIDQYLKELNMRMTFGAFDNFYLPRVTQLINKSNQFHLTTTRYSENQIGEMMKSPSHHTLFFRLEDKFGDNGLIACVILEKGSAHTFAIDTWVMSCRVLSRGVEEFIFNQMVTLAREHKIKAIKGTYIPTPKNNLVADLYGRLGFNLINAENGTTIWELNVDKNCRLKKTYIRKGE